MTPRLPGLSQRRRWACLVAAHTLAAVRLLRLSIGRVDSSEVDGPTTADSQPVASALEALAWPGENGLNDLHEGADEPFVQPLI
jgi:hypothetical protein